MVALLAEITAVEELGLDLFQGQSTAGGVFRPRHIGAMKIAGINRIIVKLEARRAPWIVATDGNVREHGW